MGRKLDRKKVFVQRLFKEDFYSHRAYIKMYDRLPVDKNTVLLESQHGTVLGGNIAKILKTLCEEEEFSHLKLYVTVRKNTEKALRAQWSDFKNGDRVKAVRFDSHEYFRILATAGRLINDNTFMPLFMKKPGQLYLNTWHGTPLKTLGRSIKGERFAIGNAQRNFLSADLLLYPNEHTKNVMLKDYMVENFGTGRLALTGYPRNEVFFSQDTREEMRERFNLNGKRVYAYLPTWRGIVGNVDRRGQENDLDAVFTELDSMLPEDMAVYVKLHPMLRGSMNTENYKHILTFPDDVPSYDFLQATDGLITDYSSIMFDYAVTHRPIILYTYDEETYSRERGLLFPLSELPFPRVKTVKALSDELAAPTAYDDESFIERFCPWDREGVTKELMRNFISGDLSSYPQIPSNGRKNVAIYGGDFIRNGIATALINLVRNIDREKFNYLILYKYSPKTNNQPGYHEPALDEIPMDMSTLGITNPRCGTWYELIMSKLWKRAQRLLPFLPFNLSKNAYERIARREAAKTFGNARIDAAIQFNGYFPDIISMFKVMDCGRAIFVHNDMNGENRKSFAVPRKLLSDAYTSYDEVAIVAGELAPRMDVFIEGSGYKKRDYTVIPNIIDYKTILKRAEEPLVFDENTETDITEKKLKEILDGPEKVIINVGRFSYEKGQLRLIDAFEKAASDFSDARLIILGSYGPDYQKVADRAASSPLKDRITVIKFLANPFPLIKRCDFLVLSSYYEGFGLVLCEADILGVPCFSTRITGPTDFMEKYNGMLVEDSTEGIAKGIRACLRGEVKKTLTVDYEEYNKDAVESFEDMVGRLTKIKR
ncbi:MAG: CDP-glycerol glycerophosphotransferase family protein [Lachnospiraceae bacterium]|nr:CDP-glycerol glycerophosphotransferase family protein [Lachnospiraceae bacterium]